MFLPPISVGEFKVDIGIGGGEFEPHINFLVRDVRWFSMWVGMPCVAMWYWVMPPITIWVICFFPSMVG